MRAQSANPFVVVSAMARTARDFPARMAVSDFRLPSDPRFNCDYANFAEAVGRLTAALLEQTQRQEPVGIFGNRSLSSYVGVMACLASGRPFVPLSPRLPHQRLSEQVRSVGLRTVICADSDRERFAEAFSDPALALAPLSALTSGKSKAEGPLPVEADGIAYIVFTSGSTGKPKAVPITYQNYQAYLEGYLQFLGDAIEPSGGCFSQTFDLNFDPALADIGLAFLRGGTLCPFGAESLFRLPEYMDRLQVTFWRSVPSLAKLALQSGQLREGAFESLKVSVFCGEVLTCSIASAWSKAAPGSRLANFYGPAETSIDVLASWWDPVKLGDPAVVSIGRPLRHARLAVIDENLAMVSGNVPGELVVSGPQVFPGYIGHFTCDAIIRMPWDCDGPGNRWYRTGDYVRMDSKGEYHFLGRRDWQFKIAGIRCEPGELESLFREVSGIEEVVILPCDHDKQGAPTGTLAIIRGQLSEERKKEILARMRRRIYYALVPNRVIEVEQMPLNASGKIDRQALQSRFTPTS